MLVAIGFAVWRRAWRQLASLLAILVPAMPASAISMMSGDYVHFPLALPYYESEIASSKSGPIDFHWPSAGFVPSSERNLLSDPSDDPALHTGRIEQPGPDPNVTRSVRHFVGHFYLVEEYC